VRQQTRYDTDLYISEESKVPDLWTRNDFGTVVVMRTVFAYVKLNERILKDLKNLKPEEKKTISKITDPFGSYVTTEKEEEIYKRLIARYGEFIEDSLEGEFEGIRDEEVSEIIDRAFKEAGYIRLEDIRRN